MDINGNLKGVDLFIQIYDFNHNMYKPEPFKHHADYNSFKLMFGFEDWSGIIGDGKTHIYYVAEYRNAKDAVLIKLQDENFGRLISKIKDWNDKHRIKERNLADLHTVECHGVPVITTRNHIK